MNQDNTPQNPEQHGSGLRPETIARLEGRAGEIATAAAIIIDVDSIPGVVEPVPVTVGDRRTPIVLDRVSNPHKAVGYNSEAADAAQAYGQLMREQGLKAED